MPAPQFGELAIYSPEDEPRFVAHRDSLLASIQPATGIESILAEELLNASWELQRVRHHCANTAAEARLNTAHAHASRNWHRSLKQLERLQSARASLRTAVHFPSDQQVLANFPLAEVKRLPKPFHIPSYIKPAPEGK